MVYRLIYWACAHQYSIISITLYNNNDCFCIIVRGRFRVGVGVDVKKHKLNVLSASGFSLYPSEPQSSSKTADLLELDCPVTDGAEAGPAGDWDSGPALYVQLHGEAARRLGPEERPLQLQNDFLFKLGFKDPWRVQEEGMNTELGSLLRFYAGKPCSIESSERIQLSGTYNVRKGKLQLPVNRWSRRQVILCGTCLMVSSVKASHTGKMHILPLIGGKVEEVKKHSHCLAFSSAGHQSQTYYISFDSFTEHLRWHRQAAKGGLPGPFFRFLGPKMTEFGAAFLKNCFDICRGGLMTNKRSTDVSKACSAICCSKLSSGSTRVRIAMHSGNLRIYAESFLDSRCIGLFSQP
uniref:PHLPP-like RA domain-containing protein n=1 Tax=Sinocyclocheilus anshuiensis TaxID=1608454 RepID=A0A671RVI3_9TELE